MNRYTVTDSATRYTRISKAQAIKLLASGEPVAVCPVRLRPGFPFAPHSVCYPKDLTDCYRPAPLPQQFDKFLREFEYYNCTDSETGRYAAFYQMEEIKKPA